MGVVRSQSRHHRSLTFTLLISRCVQNFTTDISDGKAMTSRHNSIRGFTAGLESSPFGVKGTQYEIEISTHTSVQKFLGTTFSGSVTQNTVDSDWKATSNAVYTLSQPYDLFTNDIVNTGWPIGIRGTNETGLEVMINNIATGMTN